MKKFVVLLVVVAMTCFSAMAYAADVTLGGSLEVRSRDFSNLDFNEKNAAGSGDATDTQSRMRIDVNAKAGDVKGKLELESDFGAGSTDWGTGNDVQSLGGGSGYSSSTANGNFGFREAWVNFNIPGIPVNLTAGHQLLSLGNGWFFRSMHYGSDAWVAANVTGNNTAALVNVKVAENVVGLADDTDAYVLLDVLKLNDANTVGIDITDVKSRSGITKIDLQNIGLNYNGKLGPVGLKAEVDLQMGKKTNDVVSGKDNKFAGNEIVIQGNVPLNPVTINFTIARGSGQDASTASDIPTATNGKDIKTFQTFLDIDPHYTFLYEYKTATAAGAKNTGFANTTALNVGASFAATKSLTVGADFWFLQATNKVANVKTGTGFTNSLGTEIDVKVNWQMYDNLAWNWTLGQLTPGDGLGKDTATGIQGVLAFKF